MATYSLTQQQAMYLLREMENGNQQETSKGQKATRVSKDFKAVMDKTEQMVVTGLMVSLQQLQQTKIKMELVLLSLPIQMEQSKKSL